MSIVLSSDVQYRNSITGILSTWSFFFFLFFFYFFSFARSTETSAPTPIFPLPRHVLNPTFPFLPLTLPLSLSLSSVYCVYKLVYNEFPADEVREIEVLFLCSTWCPVFPPDNKNSARTQDSLDLPRINISALTTSGLGKRKKTLEI